MVRFRCALLLVWRKACFWRSAATARSREALAGLSADACVTVAPLKATARRSAKSERVPSELSSKMYRVSGCLREPCCSGSAKTDPLFFFRASEYEL